MVIIEVTGWPLRDFADLMLICLNLSVMVKYLGSKGTEADNFIIDIVLQMFGESIYLL